jgi:hypothetical protein
VGRDKVDTYIGAMEAVTKDLMASFESTYLVCN